MTRPSSLSHCLLSQRHFGRRSNTSLHQALNPSDPWVNWEGNHLVCYPASSNVNEQCFLFTLDLCCFWSSSQSHLCLICSHCSPLSSLTLFLLAISTSWQVSGLNLQDSIQMVSAREDWLHQKPNFCSSFWVANCHKFSSAVQFYCFSSNIALCLNEESPNVFTSRKSI